MAEEEIFPRRFGKYKLLSELAQGGMGAVYLAAAGAHGMEKVCALKVVLPGLATPEYRARFMDEGKVMVRLTHGNLVQVFDVGEVGDEAYIAMEHVTGQDLRTVWNRCVEVKRAFPVDVAIHILKDACRGLAYAHSYEGLRLVHRDISPPNVMVTYAGETKVMDFGLAHSAIKLEHTQPGLVFGKVPYMSPEQARGDPLDGRTDVYAVGVVLWELLTGRRLFPSEGNQAAEIAARAKNPEPPSTRQYTKRVPPGLDALVQKALAPDPDDRFQSAEEMSAAMGRFLSTNWPGTDSHRVASFIQDLFGELRVQERQRIETQLQAAADLDAEIAAGESFYTSLPQPLAGAAGAAEDPTLVGGRYRLGHKLGEGGMGEVWEAEHADIGKRVALKLLHRGYGKNADLVSRFKREARVASRIDHPGITDVTDFGVSADGRLYFVMELLEGRPLSVLLDAEGALTLHKALDIGLQICSAMTAAHEAELIHRDLKPENVMLIRRTDDAEQVKILDFGIAKELSPGGDSEHLTRPGTTLGTPEYMAPEQAAGQAADARSDVFAVGVILYEMLCGKPPHTGDSVKEVLVKKLQEPIAPLDTLRSDLPPELSAVIMRCLAASPDARPRSMREVAVVLEAVKDSLAPPIDIPISAAFSAGSGSTRRSWSRRKDEATQVLDDHRGRAPRRLLVGGLALALVAAVGVGIAFWPFSGRANGRSGATLQADGRVARSAGARPAEGPRDRVAPAGPGADPRAAAPQDRATPPDRPADTASPPGAASGPASDAEGAMGPATGPADNGPRTVTEPTPPEDPEGPRRRARITAASNRARARELNTQAHRHIAAGRHEAARKDFLELAAIPGQRGTALTGLARLAFERGQLAEASQTARRAVAAGGGITAQMLLANSLLKLGRYREAAAEYRRVLRSRPGHAEASRNLALAESRLR